MPPAPEFEALVVAPGHVRGGRQLVELLDIQSLLGGGVGVGPQESATGRRGLRRARQIWNGMFDKKPALIARCRGTADVIVAVNFARENGLLTAVRCGGHNSSGSGSCDGGILIDLSAMNAVHVDPKTRRARVQGAPRGATLTARPRSMDWQRPAAWFRRPASAA